MPVKMESTVREGTIDDALEEGFSELQSLRNEMTEWKDNIEEKLSQTEKFTRVEECADTLDNIADCKDECVPDAFADRQVKWIMQKKKSKKSPYPRWLRAQNAVNALEAVKDELQSIIEDGIGDDDEDKQEEADDLSNSLQQTIDRIEEIIDEVNGVEFPGMFG